MLQLRPDAAKKKPKKLSSKIFLNYIKKETIKKKTTTTQFFAQLWDSLEWNAIVLYIRYHI